MVLVSAAGGSVGSAAGQIAKAMGCRAIGIAGGAEKRRILTEEFGFDAGCDYKRDDLGDQIKSVAGKGIDVYFDSVGGEMLDTILPYMNKFGRVSVCGVLSEYNQQGGALRHQELPVDLRQKPASSGLCHQPTEGEME